VREAIRQPESPKSSVVELLESGDMHLSVVVSHGDKSYRIEEKLYTDDPVYDFVQPPIYPIDPSDPYYLGQRLAGRWSVFDCSGSPKNEKLVQADVPFEVEPGMLGCLMDVVPGSRWYRALDEQQAQDILSRIMGQLIP